MHATAVVSTTTLLFCVATAVASSGASAFRTLGKKDEVEFFRRDGELTVKQDNFPHEGFSTLFRECPKNATNRGIHGCARCEIIHADEGTPQKIDLSNESVCSSCTVCQDIVSYNCSNLVEGDCVARDCQGTCTASGSNNSSSTPPTPNKSALILATVGASVAVVSLVACLLVGRRARRVPRVTPRGGETGSASIVPDIHLQDASKASHSRRNVPRWLSRSLFTIEEATLDYDEESRKSSPNIPFPVPSSNINEESLFGNTLTNRPRSALGESDEESADASSFSSISSGYSYPAANWSLPPASLVDEFSVSSYGTKDDDSSMSEKLMVRAPAGLLGLVLETPDGGAPVVHFVKSHGPLAGRVRVGDRLASVDGTSVTSYTALAVSRLIASKENNTVRELIFARTK